MRTLLPSCVVAAVLVLSLGSCTSTEPGTVDEPGPSAAVGASGTAPGTSLSYGDPATLVWQPAAGTTGELELSVDAVAEQRQSVFEGWLRDEAMAGSRPYFVTVTITNTGAADLGGQTVPLYLRDDSGRLGAPWTLGGDFTACQSGPLPTPFATGAETTMCLVFLAPDRARVADLVFEPSEGYDPIRWTGEVDRPRGGRRRG